MEKLEDSDPEDTDDKVDHLNEPSPKRSALDNDNDDDTANKSNDS